MSNTAQIIWKSVGLGLLAALLITAVVFGYTMQPSDAPCASLQYIIEDRAERMYLSEEELNQLLRTANLYPVGQPTNALSLHRIEQTVAHHPMVRTAECYLTPRNEMHIRLTQRVPLLRVQTPGETYFIDTDRRVMEARMAVKDSVLLCTGAIGVQSATTQLANFATWLQDHRYWRERVEYVRVQSPQMVYIYVKDEGTEGERMRVAIGRMSGYEAKLDKFRTFIEHRPQEVKEKNYKEYDVRFRGQVIGRY